MIKNKYSSVVIMLLISLTGVMCFYLVPFGLSAMYVLSSSTLEFKFVGISNFIELANNTYFLTGLNNTAIFILISLPLQIACALLLAIKINKLSIYRNIYSLAFLVPLVIPSATTAFFWKNFFSINGPINQMISIFGIGKVNWLEGKYTLIIIVIIFLWKNLGYNIILFISGLNNIPKVYYECISVEGGNEIQKFFSVTLIYLLPTTFLVFIMTLVNSFKVFKEIYLITGRYPSEEVYMLQHYMNNLFFSLNYPKLTTAAYILTLIIIAIVLVLFKIENKISNTLMK